MTAILPQGLPPRRARDYRDAQMLMDTPDETLALAAQSSDRNAFAALVTRHHDRVHGLGWRLTRRRMRRTSPPPCPPSSPASTMRPASPSSDDPRWCRRFWTPAKSPCKALAAREGLAAPLNRRALFGFTVLHPRG